MKFHLILFLLFSLPFFASELKAQEMPCKYPLNVSADSLVNFVKHDFARRTGKPPQIDPEDWQMYFYDNTRGINFSVAYAQAQDFLMKRLGRSVYCNYVDLTLNSFEINATNSDEFYLTFMLQLPGLENPKQQGYMQYQYEVIPIKFTMNLQPDNWLSITYPTNVPDCGGQPDCGFKITKDKALSMARANNIITNSVDYLIDTDGKDWLLKTSSDGWNKINLYRINLQTGAISEKQVFNR